MRNLITYYYLKVLTLIDNSIFEIKSKDIILNVGDLKPTLISKLKKRKLWTSTCQE